jgi:predicted amidohydrolase
MACHVCIVMLILTLCVVVRAPVCSDIEFPENSRALTLEGAQLILVPTALAKGELHETVPLKVVPTRAVDNHVWIAYANHVGPSYKDKSFCGLSSVRNEGLHVSNTAQAGLQ